MPASPAFTATKGAAAKRGEVFTGARVCSDK